MARKKSSAVQRAYTAQRRRIQSLMSSYRRKGYDVQYQLPSIPKRITPASVRRLQRITPEVVRKQTFGVDYETGEQITYEKAQKQYVAERRAYREKIAQASQRKRDISVQVELERREITPSASTVIISNFRYHISFYPEKARDIVNKWLSEQISEYGEAAVAKMLQESHDAGMWLEPKETYSGDLVQEMLSNMLDFLDISDEDKQAILDEVDEEMEFWESY